MEENVEEFIDRLGIVSTERPCPKPDWWPDGVEYLGQQRRVSLMNPHNSVNYTIYTVVQPGSVVDIPALLRNLICSLRDYDEGRASWAYERFGDEPSEKEAEDREWLALDALAQAARSFFGEKHYEHFRDFVL